MKQFLTKIYRRVFPIVVPKSKQPVSAFIQVATTEFERFGTSVNRATKELGYSIKKLRKLRLEQMYREQNLDHNTAHRIAAEYKITLHELVDYYHYFGMLPQPEHKIIIKNYGVQNLISDFENLMETV